MLTIIICAGIFLPNGNFIANSGDGHAKNARRICDKIPRLAELANASYEKEDDFLIQCGCAILACYNGIWCFKVAFDNPFPDIIRLKNIYQTFTEKKVNIYPYWRIHDDYIPVIRDLLSNEWNATLYRTIEGGCKWI